VGGLTEQRRASVKPEELGKRLGSRLGGGHIAAGIRRAQALRSSGDVVVRVKEHCGGVDCRGAGRVSTARPERTGAHALGAGGIGGGAVGFDGRHKWWWAFEKRSGMVNGGVR
jgi:hypothetical protein